jgi:bisphosphoglycerate-dependent phosphoglycerate mutase
MQNPEMFLQIFKSSSRKLLNEHIKIKNLAKKIKPYLDNRIAKNLTKVKNVL